MDVSGEHHLDVLHSVFKVRLTHDGQPIHEEAEQYQLGESKEEDEDEKVNEEEAKKIKEKEEKEVDKCGRYKKLSTCGIFYTHCS